MSAPRKFKPIGMCIYCRSTDPPLTDEHIIPQGLGGREILPAASCEKCRVITGKFEEIVQRDMVWGLRRSLGMRGKRKPPEAIPTIGTQDGRRVKQPLHHEKIAVKGALPIITRPPGIMVGKVYAENEPLVIEIFFDKDQIGERGKLGATAQVNPLATIKTLAKIAHCTAIGSYGIDGFDPFLIDLILGRTENWNAFVGGSPITEPAPTKGAGHTTQLWCSESPGFQGILWCRIRLFAEIGGPNYDVAIGRAAKVGIPPRIL